MTCSPLDLRVGKYQLWFPHPKVSNLWKKGRKFEEVTWQFYRKIFLHDNHPFTGEKLHPAFQELGVVVSAPVCLLYWPLSACCADSHPPVVLAPVCMVQREECIPVMVLDRVGPHRLGGNLRSEHVDPGSYFLLFSERSTHQTFWVPGADDPLTSENSS